MDWFETTLTPEEEILFQQWKKVNAPNDSGIDYDLKGAFKAQLAKSSNNHFADTFKKPNHPTFSDQSIYAQARPDLAGSWQGDTYLPTKKKKAMSDLLNKVELNNRIKSSLIVPLR